MAHRSLYLRYRSKTFEEVLGQDAVTSALRNAVREDRVGQAYLFSGPRGTGKTSTARILAKVLNCDAPLDGEPDTTCDNCVAVQEGRPVDWLHELDAASNGKVDDMRDLLERVSLGTSGRRKVYILDEVHMLTTGASNALLKTLEEPPDHVVFILATTDPQKVLDTIKSRTQHYQFRLLPADVLAGHVRHVIDDAGLDLDADEVLDSVLRAGGGSARDTLSELDKVAARGAVHEVGSPAEDLLDAVRAEDPGAALVAVDAAVRAGTDPRTLGGELVQLAREAFLSVMGAPEDSLSDRQRERAAEVGADLGPARLTAILESVGTALVEMRQAADPRIPLEVAVVQLARPRLAGTVSALAARVEALERRLAEGSAAPAVTAPATTDGSGSGSAAARAALSSAAVPPAEAQPDASPSPATGRPSLGAVKRARKSAAPAEAESPAAEQPAPAEQPPPADPPAPAEQPAPGAPPSSGVPSRDELTLALDDNGVLDRLSGLTKALFRAGRFVHGDGSAAFFALPNQAHRDRCAAKQGDFAAALAAHFGRPVPLQLVVDEGQTARPPGGATSEDDEEAVDPDELVDADAGEGSGLARLKAAFPGAELVDAETDA